MGRPYVQIDQNTKRGIIIQIYNLQYAETS